MKSFLFVVVAALFFGNSAWGQPTAQELSRTGSGPYVLTRSFTDISLSADRAPQLGLLSSSIYMSAVAQQQPRREQRNWIKRHPVLFGALVGFGSGFLIGYLPGNDAVFDDMVAEFNGFVLGGVGAGTGAIVGAIAGK